MKLTQWGTFNPANKGDVQAWRKALRDYEDSVGAYRTLLESLADTYAESDHLFDCWLSDYRGCAFNIDAAWDEYYEEIKTQLNSYDSIVRLDLTQELFNDTIEEWEDAIGDLYDYQIEDLIFNLNTDFNLKLK